MMVKLSSEKNRHRPKITQGVSGRSRTRILDSSSPVPNGHYYPLIL